MANTANTPSNGTGSQNQTAKQRGKQANSPQVQITRTDYVRYDKHATPAFTTYTTSISLSPYPPHVCPIPFSNNHCLESGVRLFNDAI